MPVTRAIGDITKSVGSLNRTDIKHRLKNFKGLRLDFTDKYLDRQSLSKLRHTLLAAMTTTMKRS